MFNPSHQPPPPMHQRSTTPARSLAFCLALAAVVAAVPALADIRVVNAQGEHRMGDRDTREDAIRLAVEAAKRNALEQVATYLESVTVVSDMDVTKDEIRSYTAGLVIVLNQQVSTSLDGDVVVVKVDLLAQMDTEAVAQAITALRENEDARVQLAELRQENEQLQQELNTVNQALGNATTPDQVQQAAEKRKEILNRVQSNAMVSQAWTNWVLVSPVGLPQALLNSAGGLYPSSPHIAVAQQIIMNRQPSMPGRTRPRMPSHELVPPPGAPGGSRTLNEIIYRTPTAQPQTNTQPMIQGFSQSPPSVRPPRPQNPGPHSRSAPFLRTPGAGSGAGGGKP
ncbi:MAG: hypothetical protein H8K03_14715 [Nitrospira sp.]|nr:hypothetical protein [Nitrospira sp. BO4]